MRLAADLTQARLATRLDRPQSFVAKYEGGERRLDVIEFLEVAEAIGFDPTDFIRRFSSSEDDSRDNATPCEASSPAKSGLPLRRRVDR